MLAKKKKYKYQSKIPARQMTYWVGILGYEILDEVVSPMCGISGVVADLYGADILLYAQNEAHAEKILKKILKRYKISKYDVLLTTQSPIALIALAILECGTYKV